MKGKSLRPLLGLPLAACLTILFSATSMAQAERRPLLTSHVPDEVASGIAPLVGHLPAEQRVSLAISLPARNQDQLDRLLEDLYDPQSPSYHRYLSVAEFAERFGSSEDDYAKVVRFAESNGLKVVGRGDNRMVLDVEGPAASVETAFHTTLGVFQHPTEARTFYAPEREPIVELDVPLLHISGLDNFSLPYAKNVISDSAVTPKATGSGPSGSFLGSDLRTAYYGSGSLNGAGQTVALFEYSGYNMSDINAYFNNAGEPLNVSIKAISVNGASLTCGSGCTDIEQALDIEQAISMAPGLSQLRVYVGKSDISIFNQMAADNVAKTVSCSWGWSKDQSSLDPILQEMAAQGQTVFVATGDQGSSTAANVVWPADDIWVTAVGGTVLTTNSAGGSWKSETGWQNSAGMPSKNNISIPSWQQLSGVVTGANGASSSLRNIPDVSSESNASQYVCANGTCRTQGGGTSYAAPLWASLMAMVNEQALNNGGSLMGFFNSTLYGIGTGSSFGSDFHDITSGNNGKYSAVVGYDLVTGWGSPNGANLINVLAPTRK
ncbi:MAG: S53 family peptidase [Candidatus Sulfotelmatobacter sp.]|jgi:subtilase family serine protease